LFGGFESIREATKVVGQLALVGQELNISTVDLDATFLAQLDVLLTTERGEAPVLGHDDLLATRELVLRASKGFDGGSSVRVTSSDTDQDLANVDTGNLSVWLAKGTTHTGLESIGSSARQHLVDADDVVRVGTDAHVETFLSGNLYKVFVGADTGGLEGLGRELFVLIGDEMDASWEFVDTGTLSAEIVDTKFWVRYTTIEAGLWVRLVLAVTITSCWASCHFVGFQNVE